MRDALKFHEVFVFLLLVFAMLAVVLSVVLYVMTLFIQGYTYTEPTPDAHWQAPAAGAALALFLTAWCFLITRSDAAPGNIPYDTIVRFSPKVELLPDPATKIWANKSDGKSVLYFGKKNSLLNFTYTDDRGRPWNSSGIVSLDLEYKNEKLRFLPGPYDEGGYRPFSNDQGWEMREFESGPTGSPAQFRWGRFLANFALNLLHGSIWFVCLWLLLRFEISHALGLAFIAWLFMTVGILPMIFDQAAIIARERTASIERQTQSFDSAPRTRNVNT